MNGQAAGGDPWRDRLSEYLDGELSRRQRRACGEHIARCAGCAALVEDLRLVVARAERMKRLAEPGRDLWPGIAARLSSRSAGMPAPRPAILAGWFWPRLAAAAVIVFACLAVAIWVVHVRSGPTVQQVTAQPSSSPAALHDADREYDRTVATLQRQAYARLTLDPHLVEVLDENLATLDAAIANYRDALTQDPKDLKLRGRLDAARQKKLEVLQQAVTLASEGTE